MPRKDGHPGSLAIHLLLALALVAWTGPVGHWLGGCPAGLSLLGPQAERAQAWLSFAWGEARAAAALIVDGDFESVKDGNDLRGRKDAGWYESRNIGGDKDARLQLMMSTNAVGGNATRKAMIKGDPKYNTYLSQALGEPQKARFSMQWDVFVREIMPPFNRSAFQMIGNAKARGRGPNGSGPERFVFLGFENAGRPGKMNLFAFEGKNADAWDERTLLVADLDLEKWYTIRVDVDTAGKSYQVTVAGVTQTPLTVAAFRVKKTNPPDALTHVSFASWDDGPGTFYIDNVRVP